MYVSGGDIVLSPSDLVSAAACEFAVARTLDVMLGRVNAPARTVDEAVERAAALGQSHEERVLARMREQELQIVEIPRPASTDDADVAAVVEASLAAFAAGADVITQPAVRAGRMVGYPDFVVRQPDGAYEVQDAKLARSAKVSALLQVSAYADMLGASGVTVAPQVRLILGQGAQSVHRLADLYPVYRHRHARLTRLVNDRLEDDEAIAWSDGSVQACGVCDWCDGEVRQRSDVYLVAGVGARQRAALAAAGIDTMPSLAESRGWIEGMPYAEMDGLRDQAAAQLRTQENGAPVIQMVAPGAIASLHRRSPMDVFVSVATDPLHAEPGRERDESSWGLTYLITVAEPGGRAKPIWAATAREERGMLDALLGIIMRRRQVDPAMHVYHFGVPDRRALLALAARHGRGEVELDALLRDGVIVDLYPIVRRAMRIGIESYDLESVVTALGIDWDRGDGGSMLSAFWEYRRQADLDLLSDAAASWARVESMGAGQVGTVLALRERLIELGAQLGVVPGAPTAAPLGPPVVGFDVGESAIARHLRQHGAEQTDESASADEIGWGLAAAAVDFFPRENKSYWWAHFERLQAPIAEWAGTRDVFVVDQWQSQIVERPGLGVNQYRGERLLRLSGEFGAGSTLREGDRPWVLYDYDTPVEANQTRPGNRPAHRRAEVAKVDIDAGIVLLRERFDAADGFDLLPVALTPPPPLPAGQMPGAIVRWASAVAGAIPNWPADAVSDVVRRAKPRLVEMDEPSAKRRGRRRGAGEPQLARVGDPGVPDLMTAIAVSVGRLDNSYLAVQGPPGTGKTYVGANVIAKLVMERRWRIGVVAQSHAAVENLLRGVIEAGISPARVAKKRGRKADPDATWTWLDANQLGAFTRGDGQFEATSDGFVLGGTAWDFANESRVARRSLDLLVIDEAGQFALPTTIAAAVSARNLLLLGDPQQLPQVTQGSHPMPIDTSALGHLCGDHDVLPDDFGYFLDRSWRMSLALVESVSALYYGGRLGAADVTAQGSLTVGDTVGTEHANSKPIDSEHAASEPADAKNADQPGLAPGLHPVQVAHSGRATESIEEAQRVVQIVQSLLGQRWRQPDAEEDRPLGQGDFIVVTPYNAQVQRIEDELSAAGLGDVSVGTVDRFQGREAVISIVSMAASAPQDVPRGMSFLLMRNRLNVAISRAKWASFLLYSPALLDYVPATPDGLSQLSDFMRLIAGGTASDV